MKSKKYSNDELIKFLQAVNERVGYVKADSVRESDGPSIDTIKRRFGTFNAAKEAAGLRSFKSGRPDNNIRGLPYYHYIKELVSCSICGEDRPACIEFHHVGEKTGTVSHVAGNNHSSQTVYDEMKKTIPVCANCHAEHHSEIGELTITETEPYEYPHPRDVAEETGDD